MGTAIVPEDYRRVFEEFCQIDSGHVRTQPGTGLGLAVVHNLVRLPRRHSR